MGVSYEISPVFLAFMEGIYSACLSCLHCIELVHSALQCKILILVLRIWQNKIVLKWFPSFTMLWKYQLTI